MSYTQEISIAYGSFSVGGSTGRPVKKWHKVEESYERSSVEFTFLVADPSESVFAAACIAAEAAFRTPRQALTITQGSTSILSLSHSGNTGFDSIPTITKEGQDGDSGRSRLYKVHLEFGMPADNTGTNGRQYASVEVQYDPGGRRHVTVTGIYTALSSNGSFAQYAASIDAYATSAISVIGGGSATFELAEESATPNDTDKKLTFRRVYDELVFDQSSSGRDDTDIVRSVLTIRRKRIAPGDAPNPGANRLVTLSVQYDAWIKTTNTNLTGKYTSLRSFIVNKVRSIFGSGIVALTMEEPAFNLSENKISATMEFMGATGSGVIESKTTVKDSDKKGLVLVGAWTGNSYSKYDYDGIGSRTITVTEQQKVLGDSPQFDTAVSSPDTYAGRLPGGKARLESSDIDSEAESMGLDGIAFNITNFTKVTVIQLFVPISAGGGITLTT